MAVIVDPTTETPTHHLSLSDGVTTLGLILCDNKGQPTQVPISESGVPRTVMRVSQGAGGYGDFEYPYTPVVENDFGGGRGQEDFEDDVTKYYDSEGVDTRKGDIILGPKATASTSGYTNGTTDGQKQSLAPHNSIGCFYVAPATFTLRNIRVKLDVFIPTFGGDPVSPIYARVYSDSGNNPNTLLAIGKMVTFTQVATGIDADLEITCAMTSGTKYWITFDWPAGGPISVYTYPAVGNKIVINMAGYPVLQADRAFAMTLEATGRGTLSFFNYRGALYAVTKNDDMQAPRLFLNGFRGNASANTGALHKTITGLTLTAGQLVGKIVKIVAGPGSEEASNWRTIVAHSTGGSAELYVEPSWNVTHTTSTEYVILGCDTWQEVTGHGLTGPVTDVLVVDDVVYFAMGDSITIRRGKLASGTWAWYWEGTNGTTGNKATFLALIADTAGVHKIWRANTSTSKVSKGTVPAWAASNTASISFGADVKGVFTAGTEITCGSAQYKITNLVPYGNPQIPYVLKEDSFGSISNDVYAPVPLSEMAAVADERNGLAACQFGVYLMFSMLNGMERYYDQRLDDIGPNLGEGFPEGREGNITTLLPYPGGVIATLNAGANGYSSILFWTQTGWHEIYRGNVGRRISSAFVQIMPGDTVDRLWFNQEEAIYYVPITLNPRKQSGYLYKTTGTLTRSWISGSLKDVVKYWHSMKLFTEGLEIGHQTITVEYQTDGEASWHPLPDTFDTSPGQEILLSEEYDVTGRKYRDRITLTTDDETKTPRVKAVLVDSVTRVPAKLAWNITAYVADYAFDLSGERQDLTAKTIRDQLRTWADSRNRAAPLIMRHNLELFDANRVFIDPASVQPIEVIGTEEPHTIKLLCRLTLMEA